MRCHLVFEDQGPVLVHDADTDADIARLRREAQILVRAAHPGVVALAQGAISEPGRLRTRAVLGRPLATMDDLEPSEVAGLGAVLATTVADLHDVGVVHAAIDAGHILVTAEGQPVLSGFGDATAVDPPAGPEAAVDVVHLLRTLIDLLDTRAAGAGTGVTVEWWRLLEGAGRRRRPLTARRLAPAIYALR